MVAKLLLEALLSREAEASVDRVQVVNFKWNMAVSKVVVDSQEGKSIWLFCFKVRKPKWCYQIKMLKFSLEDTVLCLRYNYFRNVIGNFTQIDADLLTPYLVFKQGTKRPSLVIIFVHTCKYSLYFK